MSDTLTQLTRKDFTSDQDVRWCPGCGDYAILANLQRTLPALGATPDNTVFVSGIGCSSRFPFYMETYGFHTIHGRAPSVATGLKLARPELDVWVITGDGDALSIGGNHFMHVLRRNINLQIVLFNNEIYGLTKGQYSPTSEVGKVTPSSPMGSLDLPVSPCRIALGANANFVARGYDVAKRLPELLTAAHAYQGTGFVEVLQNCPIFNDGAFESFAHPKLGKPNQLWVEHGKPMVTVDGKRGLQLDGLSLKLVDVGEGAASLDSLMVHDETDRNLAWMLTGIESVQVLGILFRDVNAPVYDQDLHAQLKQAVDTKGPGSLSKLLRSGHTWKVDE